LFDLFKRNFSQSFREENLVKKIINGLAAHVSFNVNGNTESEMGALWSATQQKTSGVGVQCTQGYTLLQELVSR